MRERHPPSPPLFPGSCPGSPTVNRLSKNVPEADPWCITTNSHPLPPTHPLGTLFMEHVRHRRGHCLENSCGLKTVQSAILWCSALFSSAVPPQMQSISRTRVLNPVLSGESPDAVTLQTACFPPVSIIAIRSAYIRDSRERNLHGRFYSARQQRALLRLK